jgi:hypothetical protein
VAAHRETETSRSLAAARLENKDNSGSRRTWRPLVETHASTSQRRSKTDHSRGGASAKPPDGCRCLELCQRLDQAQSIVCGKYVGLNGLCALERQSATRLAQFLKADRGTRGIPRGTPMRNREVWPHLCVVEAHDADSVRIAAEPDQPGCDPCIVRALRLSESAEGRSNGRAQQSKAMARG